MDQLKAVTAQKKKVREALKQRPDRGLDLLSVSSLLSAAIARSELDLVVDEMKHDLDSMSELGEMESLRLQMAMDRMSKMMSTLSNLLKKMSDTASQITQNMK
jgi:seryl-tRNA synthetase